jgi:uncharacterized protein YdbL (DUF1318 family)
MTTHLFPKPEEKMKEFWRSLLLLTVMTVVSCVTVNIYFPAEQVRGAADRIVDEVWGERAAGSEPAQPAPAPAKPPPKPDSFLRILGPTSAAAAQDINVSTPEIRAIREAMKERSGQLFPSLDSGHVGIGLDGLVKVRSTDGLGLKQRADIQRLVDAENQDRRRLYLEIARANGFPDKVDEVQAIFAESWSDKAAKGWYLEQEGGGWKQR